MLNELLNQKNVTGVAILCFISFVVKLMLRHTYKKMLRAASDIGHSRHRLLKTIRMRFEVCYQLKIGVPNVSLFVEKYMRHHRVFGIHMRAWEHVNMLCIILVMVGSMGNSIWNMMQGGESTQVFLPLLTGIVGTGLLLFMDFVWNTEEQWKLLQIDVTDYLENVCKPRLENEIYHPAELQNYQKEYFDEVDKVVNFEAKHMEKNGEQTVVPEFNFTAEEEEVIREVIHEYLG